MNTLQRGSSSGIVVALIIIILLVVGIIFFTGDEAVDEEVMEEEEEMEETTQSGAAVLAALGESGVSGGAAFLVDANNTAVQVVLEGTGEGSTHPAHVHAGTCDELGDIVYPLNDVIGGESTTLLEGFNISGGDYVVNVHASEEELEVSIACGTVMFQAEDSSMDEEEMEGEEMMDEEESMETEDTSVEDTEAEESAL